MAKVIIVGAGPGGLTAGMILANNGYNVEIYEKADRVGGRNASITLDGGFTFDTGPTFLMMKNILEEMFELAGEKLDDHLDLRQIDPMYRLAFTNGKEFYPSSIDHEKTYQQIKELFPGNEEGYRRMLKKEKVKYDKLVPCLQVPYDRPWHMLSGRLLKAAPYLDALTSLFDVLGRFFDDDDLKTCFTFQAKYLGMSPYVCPGTFSIISYIEHAGGIWHPIGGLHKISEKMAEIIEKKGGKIHLNRTVEKVFTENGTAKGVLLENGEKDLADYVVLNSDFGWSVENILPKENLRRWSPQRLDSKKLSCSTFMIYLGVDKVYDNIPHHSICFSNDYRKNVDEIAERGVLSEDPSFYIQNASITDSTLAPEGSSTIYILVPVPNIRHKIDWKTQGPKFRDKIIKYAETRGKLEGLSDHIVTEKVIYPPDWESDYNVYRSATFNLAHNVGQMLVFRPHNDFEDIENLYLVGGGTHPGSGLPTIYESGRISANLLMKKNSKV